MAQTVRRRGLAILGLQQKPKGKEDGGKRRGPCGQQHRNLSVFTQNLREAADKILTEPQ